MPPPVSKQRLERAAWQWADSCEPNDVTIDHIRTAYRISSTPCKKGACRRNCRGSPLCLNALGEAKWLGEIDEKYWYEVEDPEEERRPKDTFAGLKNLGATCYVNTFLQLWFHNLSFRHAIYNYKEFSNTDLAPSAASIVIPEPTYPTSNPQQQPNNLQTNSLTNDAGTKAQTSANGTANKTSGDELRFVPNTIGGHLQQVFALLQFSNRRYIDPTPFINSLGLDAALQQDAQEFSKLFLSLLEENLSTQLDPSVRNLIQEQCLGQYQYVTKCSQCKSESKRAAEFYELDLPIRGHKSLAESIDEFLKEEKLDGDNQYMCGTCNSKQNAVRYIQLVRLPPVLSLQLLRFVFDRTTGHKKKLNSFLEFPESVDLTKYLSGTAEGSTVYDLSAVLIHRGPSAYSGHYIAHVKADGGDTWYKFNDEEIEKMGGRNLQLGREEDIEGKDSNKKPKTTKGHHASRNAYMLVYVRRKENQDTSSSMVTQLEELPEQLREFVAHDNHKLDEWIKDMCNTRGESVKKGQERQCEIKQLYDMSFMRLVDGSSDFDLVPLSWISKYLASDYADKVPPISCTELLCGHMKANPDKAAHAKCIASQAADLYYAKYGNEESHRLKGELALCRECVVERCRVLRSKARMEEDNKLITAALRSKEDLQGVGDCYWVGKASLRSWKRLAMEKLREQEQQANTNGNHQTDSALKEESKKEENHGDENAEGIERIGFNEDLLCVDHDELALDEGCRRLVTGDIWRRLHTYFPQAKAYPAQADVCSKCREAVRLEQEARDEQRHLAKEQKTQLADLYLDKNRPQWTDATTQLYVISAQFLEDWRKFIREPMRRERIGNINNSMFLCSHQGFVYEPATIGVDPATFNRLQYVHPAEWKVLSDSFPADTPIEVTRSKAEDGTFSYHVTPAVCQACCKERVKAEEESRLHFKNATIYVLKVTDHNQILAGPGETVTHPVQAEEHKNEEEYVEAGKRKKGVRGEEEEPAEKVARVDAVRRSSRHRRLRGEKPLNVDAAHTLKQLKVQIMKQFSVAPFDQNLWLNGSLLNADSSSTLASLGILPGSTIYLKEDEPTEDPGVFEDISSAQHIEEGFKGTGLAGLR